MSCSEYTKECPKTPIILLSGKFLLVPLTVGLINYRTQQKLEKDLATYSIEEEYKKKLDFVVGRRDVKILNNMFFFHVFTVLIFFFFFFFFKKKEEETPVLSSSLTLFGLALIVGVLSGYVTYKTSDSMQVNLADLPAEEINPVKIRRTIFFFAALTTGICALVLVGISTEYFQPSIPFSTAAEFNEQLSTIVGTQPSTLTMMLKNAHKAGPGSGPVEHLFAALFRPEEVAKFFPEGVSSEIKYFTIRILNASATKDHSLQNHLLPYAEKFFSGESTVTKARVCAIIINLFSKQV